MELDDERLKGVKKLDPIYLKAVDDARNILSGSVSLPTARVKGTDASKRLYDEIVYVIGLSGSGDEKPTHFEKPYLFCIGEDGWEPGVMQPSWALPLEGLEEFIIES